MTLPPWLHRLAAAVPEITTEALTRFPVVPEGVAVRPGAVLALFGEGVEGPDLLFIERSANLRSHAGQPAFPGGAVDPEDAGPVEAALRESREEVGVDPAGVEVFGVLPPLWVPPSGYTVTTVLAWWREPHAVAPVDAGEVAAVARIPIAELADPANRVEVRLRAGLTGPGFRVRGLLVWGFTGGLTDKLLAFGGWARPWGPGPVLDRPETATLR